MGELEGLEPPASPSAATVATRRWDGERSGSPADVLAASEDTCDESRRS